jgi:hypothetical protein
MLGIRGASTTLTAFRVLVALGLVFFPLLLSPAASPSRLATPASPFTPTGPTGQSEEEKTGENRAAVEWSAPARGDRRTGGPPGGRVSLNPARTSNSTSGAILSRAASSDPFRNGLGCPFRC